MNTPLDLLRVDPIAFVLLAVALIFAISLHEYGHALAADLQGDRMPRAFGRLTPNPVRHLDPIGTLLIFLVGFGWGKPVEFRPEALASKRFGSALVAFAGPLVNLLLALVAAFLYVPARRNGYPSEAVDFLGLFLKINVFLAVFNLIPLPPLDGSRLLTVFLPPNRHSWVFWLDRYGFLVLLGLLLFGQLAFLDPLTTGVIEAMLGLAGA
ncbi:MAG TPA: site-2 protease family protein [Actinomycetota bacterium]|nr:site-2 protease family protein [Actinomycetota bacterium]